MTRPELENTRFTVQPCDRFSVQVPESHAQNIVNAVLQETALTYGDYDSVTFKTALGTQQFRSKGTGRNAATEHVVEVPCCEITFLLEKHDATTLRVLQAIYAAHPYEEPVIAITDCLRTLHIRGLDEDNPNRFWNAAPETWVPKEHR